MRAGAERLRPVASPQAQARAGRSPRLASPRGAPCPLPAANSCPWSAPRAGTGQGRGSSYPSVPSPRGPGLLTKSGAGHKSSCLSGPLSLHVLLPCLRSSGESWPRVSSGALQGLFPTCPICGQRESLAHAHLECAGQKPLCHLLLMLWLRCFLHLFIIHSPSAATPSPGTSAS